MSQANDFYLGNLIMNINKAISLTLLCILVSVGGNSYAVGLGYTQGRAGEVWADNRLLALDVNHDVTNYGFVLDTSVARNQVFSYRFSFLEEKNKTRKKH